MSLLFFLYHSLQLQRDWGKDGHDIFGKCAAIANIGELKKLLRSQVSMASLKFFVFVRLESIASPDRTLLSVF